ITAFIVGFPCPSGTSDDPRSGGLQSAASRRFACNCSYRLVRAFAKGSGTCPADRCCSALAGSNDKCKLWSDDRSIIRPADGGTTVARTNTWRASDVLRGLASRASLFATQHQPRLEYACVSFPL